MNSLTPQANTRLAALEPRAVEASLDRLLPQRATSWLQPRHGEDGDFVRYELVSGQALTDDDRRELVEAIAVHERALMPAPETDVVMELARLRVLTRASQIGEEDLRFAQQVYARELSAFPADVVLEVLRKWPSRSMWWPTWKELFDELDRLARRRKSRLDALRKLAEGDAPPSVEEVRARREAERETIVADRAAVAAKFEGLFRERKRSDAQSVAASLPEGKRGEFWKLVAEEGVGVDEARARLTEQPHAGEAAE